MQEVLQTVRVLLEQEQQWFGSRLLLGTDTLPSPAVAVEQPERADISPSIAPTRVSKNVEVPSAPAPSVKENLVDPPSPKTDMANTDLFGAPIDPTSDASLTPSERISALIPDGHPIKSMRTLAEVQAFAQNNILVPIDEARINTVFGVGDPHANLLIIGEAPGADEDRQGEPFVGRAGQLLTKILAAINFAREDVYIANILKSRPPNNRDPLPEEVEAHIPLLYKQIALIQPKIILCVGKTAGNGLLKRRSSLGALRGKFHDYYGISLMVTYHPAALLRNPQWKRATWEDVKLLRTRYDQMVGA